METPGPGRCNIVDEVDLNVLMLVPLKVELSPAYVLVGPPNALGGPPNGGAPP